MKNIIRSLFILPIIYILFSCSSLLGNLTGGLTDSLNRQNDVELVKEGAPAFLLLVEGLIYSNPQDKAMLSTGIQMFSAYSGAFVQDKVRKKLFTDKTKEWAMALLKTYPKYNKYATIDYQEKEKRDQAFADFLKSLKKSDVPYVFWAAYSWALSILDNIDSQEAFLELPIPKAIIARVYELDSSFYYGAPHLFNGIFFGAYPEAYGGDLKKAKEEFDKALELSEGKLFMTKLFYADYYYRPKYDKANYKKTVLEVLNADINKFPETRLLNIMAQKQAKKMLDNIDEVFFDTFNFD